MCCLYRVARNIWRRLPERLKKVIRACPLSNGLKRSVRALTIRYAQHDDIYDDEYYEDIDELASRCADAAVKSIVRSFRPLTVLDVGCGTGALLTCLRSVGVHTTGIERSRAALRRCRKRELDVLELDVETDDMPQLGHFDVVVSLEVAEHLPESCADRYVDLLCMNTDTVVFTAAPPRQGGTDHVNEQKAEYWIRKFGHRGFRFDEPLSLAWRSEWEAVGTAPYYYSNLMIFRKT